MPFYFMEYYPIIKNWNKIRPFTETKEAKYILARDFNKYTLGRWGKSFEYGTLPEDIESCDWRWGRKGRHPEYWKYVKHGACHWIVNFCLHLAMKIEPKKKWRIVTSQEHSTVWDGEKTLFDLNFLALEVNADEAFTIAFKDKKQRKIGKEMRTYFSS